VLTNFSGGVWEGSLPTLEVKKTCGKILAYCAVKTIIFPVSDLTCARRNRQKFWHGASLIQMHFLWYALEGGSEDFSHKTLSALQKYLEVLDEDLESAVSTLKF
jgi:hypothetical protein